MIARVVLVLPVAAAAVTGIAAWALGSIDKAVRGAWCKPAPSKGRSRP